MQERFHNRWPKLIRSTPIGFVLAVLIIVFSQVTTPSTPTNGNQLCDPSNGQKLLVALYADNPLSYVILPSYACGGYSGDWHIFSSRVNFTNISFGSGSNPSQNFGLGTSTASTNLTVTQVASDFVEVQLAFTTQPKIQFYYVMPLALAQLQVPQTVLYIYQSSVTQINQGSYFTDANSFISCVAPCVFQNSSNQTLILKATSGSPVTVDFFYGQYSGGGVTTTSSTTSTASTSTSTSTLPSSSTSTIQPSSSTTESTTSTTTTLREFPDPTVVLAAAMFLVAAVFLVVRVRLQSSKAQAS